MHGLPYLINNLKTSLSVCSFLVNVWFGNLSFTETTTSPSQCFSVWSLMWNLGNWGWELSRKAMPEPPQWASGVLADICHFQCSLFGSLTLMHQDSDMLSTVRSWPFAPPSLRPMMKDAECVDSQRCSGCVDRLSNICSPWEQQQGPLDTSLRYHSSRWIHWSDA